MSIIYDIRGGVKDKVKYDVENGLFKRTIIWRLIMFYS